MVAAVLVSMGGGRIGTAANEDVEDAVVALDGVEDVEAFREIEGGFEGGNLGKEG